MTNCLLRRVLQSLVVVFGVTVITFTLLHLLPGNPVRAILGGKTTAQAVRQLTLEYGFNRPLPIQYFIWLGNPLHGNLGFSFKLNESVAALLIQRIPKTLFLTGSALTLAVVLAIPAGMWQALRRNKPDDYVGTGLIFIFYSMPTFWLGLLLIVVFSEGLSWFPFEAPQDQGGLFSQLNAMVLPIATLTLVTLALFTRFMRSAMREQRIQDYVRTARAKGVAKLSILLRHILRNALLPLITLVGLSIPGVLSGSLVTETVFNYPGMGLLFFQAAVSNDFPVLLGVTLIVALATVAGNLLADVMYAVVDPRIRYVS